MRTRFLISPAYLLSLLCLIAGAIMAGTALVAIGWIVFVLGLGINVMALVVLANRDELHQAQATEAKRTPAQPTQPTTPKAQAPSPDTKNPRPSGPVFPNKK